MKHRQRKPVRTRIVTASLAVLATCIAATTALVNADVSPAGSSVGFAPRESARPTDLAQWPPPDPDRVRAKLDPDATGDKVPAGSTIAPRVTVQPRASASRPPSPSSSAKPQAATSSPSSPLPPVPPPPVPPPPVPPPSGPPAGSMSAAWGAPAWSEEFDGTALPRSFSAYRDPGSRHGDRQPGQCTVAGGVLTLAAEPDRRTCGMSHAVDQRYGRWEARIRTSGTGWKTLLIIWPESGRWPDHGETDWVEMTAGTCPAGFIHFPGHTPRRQVEIPRAKCGDPGRWINVAMEWRADGFRGWIDGQPWYSIPNEADLTGMPSGHLTIQVDDQGSGAGNAAKLEVDWVRGWS